MSNTLKVVLFPEGNGSNYQYWVAQGLELNVSAAGETQEEALYKLENSLVCEANAGKEMGSTGNMFEGIKPADIKYFNLWDKPENNSKSITFELPTFTTTF